MKRKLTAIAALAFLAITFANVVFSVARADDAGSGSGSSAPVVVKPIIECAVRDGVMKLLPGAEITECKQTKGQVPPPAPKDPNAARPVPAAIKILPTDEFTVKAKAPDGTKYELRLDRKNTVLASMKLLAHTDRVESNGVGMALLFWAFAAATVGGALFVVTRKNLIAAVMGMVGSFLGIAAVYMMLYANFLAVVQMLVYAGAIMVLFVFVVMILNRPEDEPVAPSGRAGQAIGGLAILYLVGRLVLMLMKVKAPVSSNAAPLPVNDQLTPCVAQAKDCNDWGSVKAVGTDLFNGGLFPFEAISILLLIGVVGAVAIARPLNKKDDDPEEDTAEEGGH